LDKADQIFANIKGIFHRKMPFIFALFYIERLNKPEFPIKMEIKSEKIVPVFHFEFVIPLQIAAEGCQIHHPLNKEAKRLRDN
jgi:hypothetical protein